MSRTGTNHLYHSMLLEGLERNCQCLMEKHVLQCYTLVSVTLHSKTVFILVWICLYVLEFIRHLTTRNSLHRPLTDGRDTTQVGCV